MSCEPADRILQTLRVSVPGATDDMLSLQLFNTMDEFFRRTNAWRDSSDIVLDFGTLQYPISVPNGSEFVRMLNVTHKDVPVQQQEDYTVAFRGLGEISSEMTFPDGDAQFAPDASNLNVGIFSWAIFTPDYITVTVPASTEVSYPLKVNFVLSVSKGCLEDECSQWEVPEWMWSMFFGDWLDGALARLYGMPAKPWTNQQTAVYHGRRFRNHMSYRKQESNHGFIYAPPPSPWRFPRFSR